ncbi:hypothetical protein AKJ54_00170 [candidate division MSBL1 archaeon SCGC-AAA382K21]|uniref:Uncharacterized protein n=1 Tax=candidate division MSBL1 archaeon SCGC-AAA382K21 TaxID=1698283 RepID=A0A133VLY7_9EURY|nr:hypothetical protein AKJ54_00170 [candidate division MSBL1 archaeon SCGC-AAA382K21]
MSEKVMFFVNYRDVFDVSARMRLEFKIDYTKLRDILLEDRNLERAYLFSANKAPLSDKSKEFYQTMEDEGFEAVKILLKGGLTEKEK